MALQNPHVPVLVVPPPPPGGGPPGVPGAIAAATNYRELYDLSRSPDAFLGVYGPWYAGMATVSNGNQVNQPAAIRAGLIALPDTIPMVLLYSDAGAGGDPPMVRTLHRVSVHPIIPGANTPWDGMYLGFGSDLGPGNQVLTYELPDSAFHTTDHIRVAGMDRTLEEWANNPGAHQLGPFDVDDDEVEAVKTRGFMAIPPTYVHLFLGKTLTPREAYMTFHTQAVLRGDLASCSTLEIWLRAQATVSHLVPPVAGATRSMVSRPTLNQPHADAILQRFTYEKVMRDFPHLRALGATLDSRSHDLVAAMHHEGLVREAARAAEAREARAPKLPSAKLSGHTVELLLRICEVGHETLLPPYWGDLANCAKADTRLLLQAALTRRASEPDSALLIAPTATKEMVERLNRLEFAGDSENFSTGIHPFLCVPGPRGAAEKSATLYDLIISGAAAPTLSDHALLAQGVTTPKNLYDMAEAMKTLSVLFDVGLGVNHRLAIAWRHFVRVDWEQLQRDIRDFVADQWGGQEATAACHFLRYLQLRLNDFHRSAVLPMAYGYPDIPPFAEGFCNAVRYKLTTMFPMLPASYLKVAPPTSPAARLGGASGGTGGAAGARSPSTAPGEATKTRSGEKPNPGVRQINPAPKAAHKMLLEGTNQKVADILKAHPAPLDSAGNEMCLSWHCRQSCYTNCGRKASHTNISEADATKLSNYLRLIGTQAPPAGTTA
jgi:hypothetical protein